jgi:hypothetical protein
MARAAAKARFSTGVIAGCSSEILLDSLLVHWLNNPASRSNVSSIAPIVPVSG